MSTTPVLEVFAQDTETAINRARAQAAADRLVAPSRRLYVFGGADNLFPYFTTFANAQTYALALTPAPSTTNPVSIVLLSDGDGKPVEITGADDWYALCLAGIYVSSPYREIFSTTTLPTTLPKGMRVMYEDANGVESLWVGHADGSAWPSVGYKEIVFTFTTDGASTMIVNFAKNDTGVVPVAVNASTGRYEFRWEPRLDETWEGINVLFASNPLSSTVASSSSGFARTGPPYSLLFVETRNYSGSLVGPSSTFSFCVSAMFYPVAP